MIVSHWPGWFRELYAGDWPQDYCAIDIESSGYSFDRDVITEWGHALVRGGKVVDELSLVIDWTGHAIVPEHWLRTQLNRVRQGMELAGSTCHMSIDRMRKEGQKPDKALKFIDDFVRTIAANKILFVAHGGSFDEKMICSNLRGFSISDGFSYGDNGFLDTEGIEKATQCVNNARCHPKANDTLRSYFHRVKYTRVDGVKSNLDDHCLRKYDFAAHGITRKDMHAAKTDAFCTHLLMEKYRELIAADILPSPEFPPEDHKAARKGKTLTVPPPAAPQGARVRGQRCN